MYVYIYIYLFIYIKGPIAVCYASIAATAFPGSAVIWTKVERRPAHSINKKGGKKRKNKKTKTPENSKVLLLLWYLAPFFFISFSIIIWKENILE